VNFGISSFRNFWPI